MRRLLLQAGIMIIIILILFIIILSLPIDKKYRYAFVKSACSLKSNYIYHRIYENTTALDIVFIGSSHTMCGINDSVVQKVLWEQGKHLQASNMGLCRVGRDMEYTIFKDILQRKKPKYLILEVRQDEPELGHPDFGYVADISDVLSAPLIVNRNYFGDIIDAYNIRRTYIFDMLSGQDVNTPYEAPRLAFLKKAIIADTSVLYNAVRFRWERYYRHTRPAWADEIMTRYPKAYITKIIDMARANQVKVVLVYIPNFGYPGHQPKELNYYKEVADIIRMPDSFYDNVNYWMDDEHLNSSAAAVMSDSVGLYIARHVH